LKLIVFAAVERVAARTQIEMVNMIFNAMLNYSTGSMNGKEVIENKVESKAEQDSSDADDNWRSNSKESSNNKSVKTDNETDKNDDYGTDLTSAAVHIFLYFIQVLLTLRNLSLKITSVLIVHVIV